MNLEDVEERVQVVVVAIGGERSFRRRLLELGFVPGTPLEKLRTAPFGDPIEVLVRGSSVSIRRAEAGAIEVTRAGAGTPAVREAGA